MFLFKILIFVTLISTALAGPWGILCAGKKENTIRGCDRKGCGKYGAPRGSRKHTGVDVKCEDGSVVYAPFDGRIVRQAKPYKNDSAINNGVHITGEGYCIKIFYINPIGYSGTIKKGKKLGVVLPMQKVYPGITSHIHVQNCDLSDPTSYL